MALLCIYSFNFRSEVSSDACTAVDDAGLDVNETFVYSKLNRS